MDTNASVVNQLMSQTRNSEQNVTNDDGKTQFQELMEQSKKITTDGDSKEVVVKDEKKPVAQQSEQPEDDQEDPIVAEMAAADYAVAQTVVMLPEVQTENVNLDVTQVTAAAQDVSYVTEQTVEQPVEQLQTAEQPVGTLAAEQTVNEQPVAERSMSEQTGTQTAEQPQQVDTTSVTLTVPQSNETEKAQSQTQGKTGQQENLLDNSDETRTTVVTTDAGADVAQPVFHTVEDNMVKVGETTGTAESQQTEDVDQQVVEQLTEGLSQGESTVEVKLSPRSLGDVTVKVTTQTDGTLHIALSADNIHTKALLEQHTANLESLVSTQTQRPVQVEVSQRQQEQQDSLQQDDRNSQSGYQQQQQRQHQQSSEDFLQKLRLGLLPLSVETTE
jgi:flagellar hook-length control protein FliK